VQEKVLRSDVPDYDEWLEAKAQEEYGVDYFDLNRQEKAKLDKMYGDLDLTQYDKYKTPGGENYREILLKLPVNTSNAKILEAGTNKTSGKPFVSFELNGERYVVEKTPGETDQQAVSRRIGGMPERGKVSGSDTYISSHYKADPNLLAHIRVQDFQAPTRGFAVVNTRSGNRSEVFPSAEQAQAYLSRMPENMQGMLRIDEAAGKPKKVLLVDEIQSDWHQEGRKKGYQSATDRTAAQAEKELNEIFEKRARLLGETILFPDTDMVKYAEANKEIDRLGEQAVKLSQEMRDLESKPKGVPDAPFKKNWHELAMKRVLDYAAENGYDSVAITPGAEQAKRYDLSQHIDNVIVSPFRAERGEYTLQAIGKDGRTVIDKNDVQLQDLDDYIGKDLADKARQQMVDFGKSNLTGVDLEVGGEGMKGFYDKILPDYLNNFGKQYGASVVDVDMITQPERFDFAKPYDAFRQTIPAESMRVHSFDITPQLRDEVKNKGLPLYGKMGMGPEGLAAGTGAATIGSEVFDTNNEQQVQNPVHFTENPDAMLLELMQRN
jgi:hypothetical protein